MTLTVMNRSGDPTLAMRMFRSTPLDDWRRLQEALAPVTLPDGVEFIGVGFDEHLAPAGFNQTRRRNLLFTTSGIDRARFEATTTPTAMRDFLLDLVVTTLRRIDLPERDREQVSTIFNRWRASLATDAPDDLSDQEA